MSQYFTVCKALSQPLSHLPLTLALRWSLGLAQSLVFHALDSHEHTLLGWALSAGHSPKAWDEEAEVPTVGEGRAGLASQASVPPGPPHLLLGEVHPGPSQLVPTFVSVEDVEIRCSLNAPKGQSCKSLDLLQF